MSKPKFLGYAGLTPECIAISKINLTDAGTYYVIPARWEGHIRTDSNDAPDFTAIRILAWLVSLYTPMHSTPLSTKDESEGFRKFSGSAYYTSQAVIAQMFHVSISTSKRAIATLKNLNLITTQQLVSKTDEGVYTHSKWMLAPVAERIQFITCNDAALPPSSPVSYPPDHDALHVDPGVTQELPPSSPVSYPPDHDALQVDPGVTHELPPSSPVSYPPAHPRATPQLTRELASSNTSSNTSSSESSSGNDADASTPHAAPMEKTDSQIAEEKIQRLSDMIYKAYAKHTESKLADVSIRAILKAGTATPNSIPKTAMWLLERTECYAAKCRPHMKDPYFLKSIQSPSRWFTPPKGQSECRRYLGTDEEWDREIQIKLDIAARKRQHDERLGCSLDVKKELKAFPPTLKHPISLDDFRESHTPDAASTNDALGIEYARILFAATLAVVFELPDRQARTHAIKFAAAFAKIFEVVKTLEDTDTPDVEFWEPVNSYIEDMRRSDSRFGPHLIPTTGLWFTNWLRAYCDAVEGFATYKGIMDELAKQTAVN